MFLREDRLKKLESFSIFLTEDQKNKVETYVEELILYNPRLSLVNFKSEDDLFENHILDCLLPLPYFKEIKTSRWADVGSGAGLPGVLLAIMLEDKHFTLIERSMRRSRFLETLIIRLKLKNAFVLSENVEKVSHSFEGVVFRAFRDLNEFLPFLIPLLEKGGSLYAYKGRIEVAKKELEEAERFFQETELRVFPSLSQKERSLLVLTL